MDREPYIEKEVSTTTDVNSIDDPNTWGNQPLVEEPTEYSIPLSWDKEIEEDISRINVCSCGVGEHPPTQTTTKCPSYGVCTTPPQRSGETSFPYQSPQDGPGSVGSRTSRADQNLAKTHVLILDPVGPHLLEGAEKVTLGPKDSASGTMTRDRSYTAQRPFPLKQGRSSSCERSTPRYSEESTQN